MQAAAGAVTGQLDGLDPLFALEAYPSGNARLGERRVRCVVIDRPQGLRLAFASLKAEWQRDRSDRGSIFRRQFELQLDFPVRRNNAGFLAKHAFAVQKDATGAPLLHGKSLRAFSDEKAV